MRNLLKYLKPYKLYVILAPLSMLVEVLFEIQIPRLMGRIVDIGIQTGDISYVFVTGAKMLGFAAVMSFGGMGCIYFASKASQNFGADLRYDLFKKIQSFSFSDIDHFRPASLITRLTNDVIQVQNLVLTGLRMMTRSPLISIGGFIMAASINLKLSLILAVTLPILVGLILFIIKKSFPLFSLLQRKLDNVNSIMRENLSGIRVIKAFVRSDYEKKRFEKANAELTQVGISSGKILASSMPVIMIVMNLAVVGILWYGGFLTSTKELEVGQIIAFINYTTQILHSFMMIGFMFIAVSRAKVSSERINEVLVAKVDMSMPENPYKNPIKEGKIEFKNVSFRYKTGNKEYNLSNINLTISPGERIAILGETGSGKSTLVSLIPRLYDAVQGQVLIDGVDVRDYDLDVLRSGIGIVLQDTILFSGTVEENIKWGDDNADEKKVREAAEISQASEFLDAIPEGLKKTVGQRGVGLSGGQRQRVAIARAVIKQPKILILDDSTSAVDVMTEAKIQKGLKKKLGSATTITIAQRISTALDADRIIVMKDGKIAEEGTHKELIELGGIYLEIYKSQLGTEGLS
ncbi:MAG: ABC transporter ATP-binding protein [Eubacteriales bacterium]|nr:ABC transporter ATP-binding protein [Eubacteriales bacterium]